MKRTRHVLVLASSLGASALALSGCSLVGLHRDAEATDNRSGADQGVKDDNSGNARRDVSSTGSFKLSMPKQHDDAPYASLWISVDGLCWAAGGDPGVGSVWEGEESAQEGVAYGLKRHHHSHDGKPARRPPEEWSMQIERPDADEDFDYESKPPFYEDVEFPDVGYPETCMGFSMGQIVSAESEGPILIEDIPAGWVSVNVELIDADGRSMEFGSAIAEVIANEVVSVDVQLYSVSGSEGGGLDVNVIRAGDEGGYEDDYDDDDDCDDDDCDDQDDYDDDDDQVVASPLSWHFLEFMTGSKIETDCDGARLVAYNEAYGMWIGAILCTSERYKLLMSKSEEGPYYDIADFGGHGQDHCELVNPKFELPNDDDITSGGCDDCRLGDLVDVIDTPAFARSSIGEEFEFVRRTTDWADLTTTFYECGVLIK